jgi:RND family efflux transporter MFP subunit
MGYTLDFLVTFSYFFFASRLLSLPKHTLYTMLKYIFYGLCLLALSACQAANSAEEEAKAQAATPTSERVTLVRLATAKLQPFNFQLLANGKISALLQSKLYFKAQGIIEKIYYTNNAKVRAGQVIAVLDNRQQAIALEQAQNQFSKAQNDLFVEIVSYGGTDRDTNSIKPRVLETLKTKVGYKEALTAIKNAQLQYDNTFLIAPYAGLIANLKAKPHNLAPTTEPFCTLLSRDNLVVEISILESELSNLQIGQGAKIQSLAMSAKKYEGKVIEINPFVNEQGLVLVKVKIENADSTLLEGMNVNVMIEEELSDYISIPKTAVVERSGRKVVFSYESGLAKWHYVTVAHENSTQVAISEGLKAGEQVIIDGNLNLGHDAPVEVIKDEK